jgi:predicted transcriptional regulator
MAIQIGPNLSQFAKQNNLDYSALKKLVNGRAKTYKNLKVYNPLEKYKDSQEPK